MQKIPTMFIRDPDNRAHVLDQITPGCEWVLAGEGIATRKYDGTCVMYDGQAWWARREVKPGKKTPPNYLELHTDDVTGRTVGWEPIAQSAFAKFHAEALADPLGLAQHKPLGEPPQVGTYELCGPKVNGNPEQVSRHLLVRHGYMSAEDQAATDSLPLSRAGLREWLSGHTWEGVVFHHPDGRMAKIKKRDFPA